MCEREYLDWHYVGYNSLSLTEEGVAQIKSIKLVGCF